MELTFDDLENNNELESIDDCFPPLNTNNKPTNAEYHAHSALGSTMLSILLDNAYKYNLIKQGKLELKGKHFDMGTVGHTKLLEPHDSENVFAIYPNHFFTNSGTFSTAKSIVDERLEFEEVNRDKIIINEKENQIMNDTVAKALKLPRMSYYLENGVVEKSFFATVDIDGKSVNIKARPDLFFAPDPSKPMEIIVIDFKTTGGEATPDEFAKSSSNYNYSIQEHHYRTVLEANGYTVLMFLFAYASKREDSGAIWCIHSDIDMDYAKDVWNYGINKLLYCEASGEWREDYYSEADGFDDVNTVVLPAYNRYKYINV